MSRHFALSHSVFELAVLFLWHLVVVILLHRNYLIPTGAQLATHRRSGPAAARAAVRAPSDRPAAKPMACLFEATGSTRAAAKSRPQEDTHPAVRGRAFRWKVRTDMAHCSNVTSSFFFLGEA